MSYVTYRAIHRAASSSRYWQSSIDNHLTSLQSYIRARYHHHKTAIHSDFAFQRLAPCGRPPKQHTILSLIFVSYYLLDRLLISGLDVYSWFKRSFTQDGRIGCYLFHPRVHNSEPRWSGKLLTNMLMGFSWWRL